MIPWMLGIRRHFQRARESPDTTTKPDGKALKTASASLTKPQETIEGRGVTTLEPEQEESSSEGDDQSALVGLGNMSTL